MEQTFNFCKLEKETKFQMNGSLSYRTYQSSVKIKDET
jgi:hypothetical protein